MLSYEGTTSSCTSLGKDFILDLAFRKSNTTEVKHRWADNTSWQKIYSWAHHSWGTQAECYDFSKRSDLLARIYEGFLGFTIKIFIALWFRFFDPFSEADYSPSFLYYLYFVTLSHYLTHCSPSCLHGMFILYSFRINWIWRQEGFNFNAVWLMYHCIICQHHYILECIYADIIRVLCISPHHLLSWLGKLSDKIQNVQKNAWGA